MDEIARSAPDLRPLFRLSGGATVVAAAAALVPDPLLRAFTLPFLLSASLTLVGALILARLVRLDQPRALLAIAPAGVGADRSDRSAVAEPPAGPPSSDVTATPRPAPARPAEPDELMLGPELVVRSDEPPAPAAAPTAAPAAERLGVARRAVVTLPQRRRAMLLIETALCSADAAPEPIARPRRMALGPARRLDLDLELLEQATRLVGQVEPAADTWLLPLGAGTPVAARAALQALAETAAAVSPRRRLVLLFDELPDPTGWRSLRELRLPATVGLGLAAGASLGHEPETLARFGIGLLLLDRDALPALSAEVDPDPLRLARLRALRAAGVAVVLDGLDLETQLRDRLDWPVELGAGLLFGAAEELG